MSVRFDSRLYLENLPQSNHKEAVRDRISTRNYEKSLGSVDRVCEVLKNHEQALGFWIYKKDLEDIPKGPRQCFRLRNFEVFSKNPGLIDSLLSRVLKVAKQCSAKHIVFAINDKNPLLQFFLGRDFQIIETWKDDATTMHGICKDIESSFQKSQNLANQQRVGMKRSRDEVQEPSDAKKPRQAHWLPMKGVEYLEFIKRGEKTHEGRINGPACRSMRVGDHLSLYDNRARKGILCEITSISPFRTFEEMLGTIGVLNLLPQLRAYSSNTPENLIAQGIKIYMSFPGSNRVHQQGVVALGVKFIQNT